MLAHRGTYFGKTEVARRPVQQMGTKRFFQLCYRLADARTRRPEAARSLGKTTDLDNAREDRHQIQVRHRYPLSDNFLPQLIVANTDTF